MVLLPAPFRPEEAHAFPALDGEARVVENGRTAEGDPDVLHAEERHL